jgi:hypothetical protein
VPELYEQFAKFSKMEILQFHKLEQQRKVSKPDEATRPRYNDNQRSYPRPVHNIDSDGCGPPENWEKNFGPSPQERNPGTFDQRSPHTAKEAKPQIVATVMAETHTQLDPCTACTTEVKPASAPKIPHFPFNKQKMEQQPSQPSRQPPPRDVNHTMQWTPNHQQYSPSYHSLFPAQTHQSNQAQPPAYYQPYHYTITNHPPPPPAPQITYTPAVPQITYPVQNNNQVKTKANPPPPPSPQLHEH